MKLIACLTETHRVNASKQKVLLWSSISLSIITLGADVLGSNSGVQKEMLHTHTDRDYLDIGNQFVFVWHVCLTCLGLGCTNGSSCGLDSSLDAIAEERNEQGEFCY